MLVSSWFEYYRRKGGWGVLFLLRMLVGSYRNCRFHWKYIYIYERRLHSIIVQQRIKNSLSTLFLCLSWEAWEGEDPTADDVFCNTFSPRPLFIDYMWRRSRTQARRLRSRRRLLRWHRLRVLEEPSSSTLVISPSLSPSTTLTSTTSTSPNERICTDSLYHLGRSQPYRTVLRDRLQFSSTQNRRYSIF